MNYSRASTSFRQSASDANKGAEYKARWEFMFLYVPNVGLQRLPIFAHTFSTCGNTLGFGFQCNLGIKDAMRAKPQRKAWTLFMGHLCCTHIIAKQPCLKGDVALNDAETISKRSHKTTTFILINNV